MKNKIPFEIRQIKTKDLILKSYVNFLVELLFWNKISEIYIDAQSFDKAIDLILWGRETLETNHSED